MGKTFANFQRLGTKAGLFPLLTPFLQSCEGGNMGEGRTPLDGGVDHCTNSSDQSLEGD